LLVLAHPLEDAVLAALLGELPLVVAQAPRDTRDPVTVLAVGEVGAVRAAPEHELRRPRVEVALATVPEDALPARQEERDVDLPDPADLFRVGKRRPLPARPCHGASGARDGEVSEAVLVFDASPTTCCSPICSSSW